MTQDYFTHNNTQQRRLHSLIGREAEYWPEDVEQWQEMMRAMKAKPA